MKSVSKTKLLLMTVLGLFVLLAVPSVASAVEDEATDDVTTSNTDSTRSDRVQSLQDNQSERQEANQARLTDKKLEICQKREAKITNIMKRIGDRADRQVALFSKITDRVQNFYVTNELSVDNYDTLVAAVNDKKATAQGLVTALKGLIVDFDCEGDDPKGVTEVFKTKLKETITTLKEYKTAVKNLIVAVKTAAGTGDSTNE